MIGAALAVTLRAFCPLLDGWLHMRKERGTPLALAFVPYRIPALQRLHTGQSQLQPQLCHRDTDYHAIWINLPLCGRHVYGPRADPW
jgi:hypothetical protein